MRHGSDSSSRYRMLVLTPSVVEARRRRPSWSVCQPWMLPGFSAIISISPVSTSSRNTSKTSGLRRFIWNSSARSSSSRSSTMSHLTPSNGVRSSGLEPSRPTA